MEGLTGLERLQRGCTARALHLSTAPPACRMAQVLAASGSELQVVRGEAGGQPQLGPLVDMAVYSK